MLILVASMLIFQWRNPSIAIGGWVLALALILSSKISWYFTWYGTSYYAGAHTFRLCVDLLVGIVLLTFTGRTFRETPRSALLLLWNCVAFEILEVLYGMEVARALPYVICAAVGAAISLLVAAKLRRAWTIPLSQVIVWGAIAAFSVRGNYRASAYLGLAAVYFAAALHIWLRLRKGSLGRIGIVMSLGMWSISYLVHPWVLYLSRYRNLGDQVWDLQKFFITAAMLMFLLEEKIRENAQLAFYDQLTGLPNRRLMEQRLITAMEDGKATLLLMDLDGFKGINDTLGHLAGDDVLREIALRVNKVLGLDETIARLGGDEFLIISTREAGALTALVSSSFLEPVLVEGDAKVNVKFSIGSSTYPEDANGSTGTNAIGHLLRSADRRMYALKFAKEPGHMPRRPEKLSPA
jgi:diguanylate cyclase